MSEQKENIRWIEITPDKVEGKGWAKTAAPFDRLPAKAEKLVPDAWTNSHTSTGMCVFFNTDTTTIRIREALLDPIGEANFNASAHSGVDLYVYDDDPEEQRWRWAMATPHFVMNGPNPEYDLLKDLPKKKRRCRLYLPLRNRLAKLEIGIDEKASFAFVPPRKQRPLMYYGTSIVHGAFSVRSGLGITQILGRKLDMPVINLGFSGAARMEKAMAEILAELDPELYVIDPFHNVDTQIVGRNTEIFIDTLCSARPDTPVFMIGAPVLLHAWLFPDMLEEQQTRTELYGKICRKMMKKYPNLHYFKGANLYGSEEVSMDGWHPNDEAFTHMAKCLEREIRKYVKLR